MDQRTCRSYSLPCFSFPALVDGVNSDVVSGHWQQALHDGGGNCPRDPEDHIFAPCDGGVLQPVVSHLAWGGLPCDLHGALGLIRHDQSFTAWRGYEKKVGDLS